MKNTTTPSTSGGWKRSMVSGIFRLEEWERHLLICKRRTMTYMMHRRALLFAGPDHPLTQKLQTGRRMHPRKLRDLGRQIPGFDETVWEVERDAIVAEGTYLKFSQNPSLAAQLLATGTREIVEASPRDRIWGGGVWEGVYRDVAGGVGVESAGAGVDGGQGEV
ncbi:hypothetical protein BO99DRAFT_452989, partial [Aspergillus violaceofuscus CBS 115571]